MPKNFENIPDWAAVTAIAGVLLSFVCLISAFLTNSGFATLGLTIGLILVALSMNAAEQAINDTRKN